MKILHIDSSVRNDWSVSKDLTAYFIGELKKKYGELPVEYMDLAANTPAHPTALWIQGNYSAPEQRTPEMIAALAESEAIVDRLHEADIYVMGMPMYNFSVPSIFKAFIDNIVRLNRTFTAEGEGYVGMLKNKKVYIINTRGVDFDNEFMKSAQMDQLQPYLERVFGFLGLTNLTFINVYPVQFSGQEARDKAIRDAKDKITTIVGSL